MKKRSVGLALTLFLLLGAWKASGVDIVHDPISYANALIILAEIIKNYEQLKAQHDLQVWNSTTLPAENTGQYRLPSSPWNGVQIPVDRFGNLSTWQGAVNAQGSASAAYDAASVRLKDFQSDASKLAAGEVENVGSQYASIELADRTNINTMEALGVIRGNTVQAERALQSLEDDALSSAPELNTEIGVLNKINAASIGALRLSRDTNRLLLSALEQQLVESKRRRDADASEINVQIIRLERGDEAKNQHSRTLGQTLQTFRW